MVVILRELQQQMIDVSIPEDDEFVPAFQFDRFDEPLAASTEVGAGLW
jgi:hypothetical protein